MTGIVLAGGKSKRMGQDKALIQINGKRLIEYSIDTLTQLCQTVVISANNNLYTHLGLRIINDIHTDIGPIGGLHSCLHNLSDSLFAILPCDMPFVNIDIFRLLLSERHEHDLAVAFSYNQRIYPLCGIYSKTALPIIERQIATQNYRMTTLLQKLHAQIIELPEFMAEKILRNINSPDLLRE